MEWCCEDQCFIHFSNAKYPRLCLWDICSLSVGEPVAACVAKAYTSAFSQGIFDVSHMQA